LPVPLLRTAQNNPNSGDQQTDVLFPSAVREVHLTPSGDVATLPPALLCTAQKRRKADDQHTLVHVSSDGDPLVSHNDPTEGDGVPPQPNAGG